MSRIGKKPNLIPSGVEVKIENGQIFIKGPKGELKQSFPDFVRIEMKNNQINVAVDNPENKEQRSCWGTFGSIIANMLEGVTKGFEKKLELVGVGYRAKTSGNKIILNIGFSHPVEFIVPDEVKASVDQNFIIIQGIDKQLVGEVAAQIRRLKKPEPYKGKGIRYFGEVVRKKAGKKAATVAS